MKIVSPLTWDDALTLADDVIWRGEGNLMRDRLAKALCDVDVASREQALDRPVHDPATCKTCILIDSNRKDEFIDSPTDNYTMPEER